MTEDHLGSTADADLQTLRENDPLAAAAAHRRAGKALLAQSRYQQAEEQYGSAAACFKELGQREPLARTLTHQAVCCLFLGEQERALPLLTRAERLAAELELEDLQAAAAGNLGLAYALDNDYTKAVKEHKRVLEYGEKLEDDQLRLHAQINLADCYLQDGRPRQAQGFALVAHDLAQNTNARSALVKIYHLLGMISAHQSDHRQAVEYHQQASQLAAELGDLQQQGLSLANQALSLEALTDIPQAVKRLTSAREILRTINSTYLEKIDRDLKRMKRSLPGPG